MSGNSGFNSRTSGDNDGTQFVKKKSATFADKKSENLFYYRFFPSFEGYRPDDFGYHIETAVIRVKGKDKVWPMRSRCLGMPCPKCLENKARYGTKRSDTPFKVLAQYGLIFMAFRVYPQPDGSFSYFKNPGAAPMQEPEVYRGEYKGRPVKTEKGWRIVYDDWDNFMTAYNTAMDNGIDPLDPVGGCIFEARYAPVPVPGLKSMKDVWEHKALLDKRIALPEAIKDRDGKLLRPDWKGLVEQYYSIGSLYATYSLADMKILVETSSAIESLLLDSTLSEEEKKKRHDELYANYSLVSDADFRRILSSMERKADEGGNPAEAQSSSHGASSLSLDSTPTADATSVPSTASAPAAFSVPVEAPATATVDHSEKAASPTAPTLAEAPAQADPASGLSQSAAERLKAVQAGLRGKVASRTPPSS